MKTEKQQLLIEYLISSTDTFAICQGIVQSKYFDPELRPVVQFIKDYYENYSTTPDLTQVKAETGVILELHDITSDQIEYTTTEIETFCRRRGLEIAVVDSLPLIEQGRHAEFEKQIHDAISISLQRNLGLRYFENVDERLQRNLEENSVQSTGWDDVDELLFGGLSRKELLLVSANSGGGKSITLSNIGLNFVLQGLNVLYLSLELSEDVIAQRFDTMLTGVSRKVWKQHVSEIATRVQEFATNPENGVLDIKQMPSGTTPREIESFLKEYYLQYKFLPDMLIVDYLDKMNPNEKIDYSDVWTKDKLVSERVRDIGVKNNMFIATASQLNRDAIKAVVHDHSHIAGGISKINESDVYWSITLSESMKASCQICFTMQKTRNSDGVGKTVYLAWDEKFLRIRNNKKTGQQTPLLLKKKSSQSLLERDNTAHAGLLDIMKDLNS